jgi:heme exporter protein B
VLMPMLLASVKGTSLALLGDPQEQLPSWLKLLSAFDLIYLSLGFLLFPRVVEDD